jgi:hypothetical protein
MNAPSCERRHDWSSEDADLYGTLLLDERFIGSIREGEGKRVHYCLEKKLGEY